jgi:hypothetical protein
MINLDFSEVQSFEAIPDGKYVATIEKVEEKTSQAGNQMLNVTFAIADGEYAGRKIFDNYVLTPKSLWRLKQLLSSLGVDASGAVDLDPTDLIGRAVIIDVNSEEYNGQTRNRIKGTSKAPDVIL